MALNRDLDVEALCKAVDLCALREKRPAQGTPTRPSKPDLVRPLSMMDEATITPNLCDDAVTLQPQTHPTQCSSPSATLNQPLNVSQPLSTVLTLKPNPSGVVCFPKQRMVYNPRKPNMPPLYPCGVCHMEVYDYEPAILCEAGCNFWFHRACTKLTDILFDVYTHEVFTQWLCDRCTSSKNV
ncbi:hypothetical protein HPB50_000577 [Hyalomma asiaticum]|uniref:Uncharacterized protein n=1 Tax=Hyalomma asiaticum TaxID=266040 RepID=A0ACB7T2T2_HYAAI|nr:hypothetical protein HPB50_000577 [Hyalomma asiaticum]